MSWLINWTNIIILYLDFTLTVSYNLASLYKHEIEMVYENILNL